MSFFTILAGILMVAIFLAVAIVIPFLAACEALVYYAERKYTKAGWLALVTFSLPVLYFSTLAYFAQ